MKDEIEIKDFKKIKQVIKPFITPKRVIFLILWVVLFYLSYSWLISHPEYTTFVPDNIKVFGNETYYLENGVFSQPPPAYKIYLIQKQYGKYINWIALLYILIWIFRNRFWIKQKIKEFQSMEDRVVKRNNHHKVK